MSHAPLPRGMSRSATVALLLAVALAAATVALALTQVRGWDGSTNADGVSYLHIASRFHAGDWRAAGNGYWSPLYPAVLAGGRRIAALLPGAPRPELAVVFAVNVTVFAIAALAFARLAWLLFTPVPAPAPALVALRVVAAAAIALWSLVRFIGATTVTPDALLAAILYLAAAELVGAWRGPPSAARDVRMGVLLAAGYWTKAVFLPVSAAAIAAYLLVVRRAADRADARRGERGARRPVVFPRVLVATLVLCLPLVALQSWTQGRPSFGETGRLNYRWYVGGAPRAEPVREPPAATRGRKDPAAVALDSVPGAVLFTGPADGAFPYWQDPSRYEPAGIGPLSWAAQWRAIRFNLPWYRATGGALFGAALVAAAGAWLAGGRRRWGRLWCTVPAAATLALYTLTHVEGRMGAAPLACILLALLALHDPAPRGGRRAAKLLEGGALAVLAALALGRVSNRIPRAPTTMLRDADVLPQALREAGLATGATVGVAGEPYGMRWAHETGTHVMVVVPAAVVSDGALAAVLRESRDRGTALAGIVVPPAVRVPLQGALPLPGGWRLVRGDGGAR